MDTRIITTVKKCFSDEDSYLKIVMHLNRRKQCGKAYVIFEQNKERISLGFWDTYPCHAQLAEFGFSYVADLDELEYLALNKLNQMFDNLHWVNFDD